MNVNPFVAAIARLDNIDGEIETWLKKLKAAHPAAEISETANPFRAILDDHSFIPTTAAESRLRDRLIELEKEND